LLTAGCIPSLSPLCDDGQLVVRDEILGRWKSPGEPQTWQFSKRDASTYQLLFSDKQGRQANFQVRLTEINGALFMDLVPARDAKLHPDFYNLHLISTHTFYRIEVGESSLSLSFLNPQWLKTILPKPSGGLAHVRNGNSLLLTAETPQLRQFVAEHLNTPGAFTDPHVLHR
jgi:hypothetical protein